MTVSTKKKQKAKIKEQGKTLVIAEKPSVAQDIAKALPGRFKNHKTYFENDS